MRAVKIIIAVIYALAGVIVIGSLSVMLFMPKVLNIVELMRMDWVRYAMLACLCIVALGILITLIRSFISHKEPDTVRPEGNRDIEVSVGALTSTARAAAEESDDVMIEHVEGHITGRDRSEVRFNIDAIPLTGNNLESTARDIQDRVVAATERMLGSSGVTARVRFLPSKMTTKIREVDHE